MDMGNRLGSESPIRESMLCVERWKSAVFQAGVGLPEDKESDSQEHVGLLGLGSLVLCTNLRLDKKKYCFSIRWEIIVEGEKRKEDL